MNSSVGVVKAATPAFSGTVISVRSPTLLENGLYRVRLVVESRDLAPGVADAAVHLVDHHHRVQRLQRLHLRGVVQVVADDHQALDMMGVGVFQRLADGVRQAAHFCLAGPEP